MLTLMWLYRFNVFHLRSYDASRHQSGASKASSNSKSQQSQLSPQIARSSFGYQKPRQELLTPYPSSQHKRTLSTPSWKDRELTIAAMNQQKKSQEEEQGNKRAQVSVELQPIKTELLAPDEPGHQRVPSFRNMVSESSSGGASSAFTVSSTIHLEAPIFSALSPSPLTSPSISDRSLSSPSMDGQYPALAREASNHEMLSASVSAPSASAAGNVSDHARVLEVPVRSSSLDDVEVEPADKLPGVVAGAHHRRRRSSWSPTLGKLPLSCSSPRPPGCVPGRIEQKSFVVNGSCSLFHIVSDCDERT